MADAKLPFSHTPPALRVLSFTKPQPNRIGKKGLVSAMKKASRPRSRPFPPRPGRARRNALRGDFYRPSPLNPQVTSRGAHTPPPASEAPQTSSSEDCSETDLEALLDDVFADLALNAANEAGCNPTSPDEAYDTDEDCNSVETPPLAGWQYPEEYYEEERRKFSAFGGKSLDRTFIGRAVPRNEELLSGVDAQL
ncbi:hypothetical protein HDU87_007400 [Geranomyces variabilis]|uniref:Uncharacterized protein n=1 Tax=Geranomyces variabilis TaxID=109894 RepID=A0AAD5TPB8_9FUNG|nr:hypothetical protein HDU87_007400 [Geranomyces variabilis]